MKLIFTCPETHNVFESDAFRIIGDEGVRVDPSGERFWEAQVELMAPCPLCGRTHVSAARDLACPFRGSAV